MCVLGELEVARGGMAFAIVPAAPEEKNTKPANPSTATGTPTAGPMMDPNGFELEAVVGDGVEVAGIGTTVSLD